jgi:uncharacterized protein DUF4145
MFLYHREHTRLCVTGNSSLWLPRTIAGLAGDDRSAPGVPLTENTGGIEAKIVVFRAKFCYNLPSFMAHGFYPPTFRGSAFNCPHCSVYADQTWSAKLVADTSLRPGQGIVFIVPNLHVSHCRHCGRDALWVNENLLFPENTTAPLPNPDMPEDVMRDYLEASSISAKSPRGAAALLRLAVQKLCIHLGQAGKNINDDIANLVKAGLPVRIQKALDIVRVIGNNAVHPGVIDINDQPETVHTLFTLINQIVQDRITQPKEIDLLYNTLPKEKRNAIEKRDALKP